MAKAFTTKSIEAMKPGKDRREVPDPSLSGLYLVIQPSGAKSWALRYRFDGKPRKVTLGKLRPEGMDEGTDGFLGLAEARAAAGAALETLHNGRDPGAVKKAEKAEKQTGQNTMRAQIDIFTRRHLSTKRTGRAVRQALDGNLPDDWWGRDVDTIQKKEIVALLDTLVDADKGYTANRLKAYLSRFFSFCEGRGVIDQNPALGIKTGFKEKPRDRPLTDDEVRLFWAATGEEGAPYGTLFRLLLLTGQRRGEVAEMRWQDIGDDGVWHLSETATKNETRFDVPLPPLAMDLIDAMPRLGDYVFTTNGKTPSNSLSKPHGRILARMNELAAPDDVPRWRPHDLRHTCKTGLASLGVPLDVRARVTNHLSDLPPMDRRYNHYDYATEKRDALTAWANHLIRITTP